MTSESRDTAIFPFQRVAKCNDSETKDTHRLFCSLLSWDNSAFGYGVPARIFEIIGMMWSFWNLGSLCATLVSNKCDSLPHHQHWASWGSIAQNCRMDFTSLLPVAELGSYAPRTATLESLQPTSSILTNQANTV